MFQVKKDIAELELLQSQATRQKVKDILSIEIRKLVSQVVHLEEAAKIDKPADKTVPDNPDRCYEVKLNNYGKTFNYLDSIYCVLCLILFYLL